MRFTERLSLSISKALGNWLPARTKRLFALASLSSYLCNKSKYDREYIRKLNEVMRLSTDDRALMWPTVISKVVWKNANSDTLLYPKIETPSSYKADLAKELTERIPLCLQYSTYQDMFEDIKKLLENKPVLSL